MLSLKPYKVEYCVINFETYHVVKLCFSQNLLFRRLCYAKSNFHDGIHIAILLFQS